MWARGAVVNDGSASGLGEVPMSVAKERSRNVMLMLQTEKQNVLFRGSFDSIATVSAVEFVFSCFRERGL